MDDPRHRPATLQDYHERIHSFGLKMVSHRADGAHRVCLGLFCAFCALCGYSPSSMPTAYCLLPTRFHARCGYSSPRLCLCPSVFLSVAALPWSSSPRRSVSRRHPCPLRSPRPPRLRGFNSSVLQLQPRSAPLRLLRSPTGPPRRAPCPCHPATHRSPRPPRLRGLNPAFPCLLCSLWLSPSSLPTAYCLLPTAYCLLFLRGLSPRG